jgi:plastin-1
LPRSKLINTTVIGKVPPISPAAINNSPKSVYQSIENLNLAIESAKAIGCTVVNIQPQFIMEKREHIILGLIWQIIKVAPPPRRSTFPPKSPSAKSQK